MKILVVEVDTRLSEEQSKEFHDYVKACVETEKILILPSFAKSYVAEIDDIEICETKKSECDLGTYGCRGYECRNYLERCDYYSGCREYRCALGLTPNDNKKCLSFIPLIL